MPFTHLNADGRPAMVDVGDKSVTKRSATAEARVILGSEIMESLRGSSFSTKKGSIIQTAIIAATMAVKQTWSVIPLCHPLIINGVSVEVDEDGDEAIRIRCTVKTEGKTGVEMEALYGASVAALTVYDMCKSMSPAIAIGNLCLVQKRGGKSDFDHG